MRVKTAPHFERDFRKLDKAVRDRILEKAGTLASDPALGKRLGGKLEGAFSLRVGDYRVVYAVREDAVHLLFVGHRRGVYR